MNQTLIYILAGLAAIIFLPRVFDSIGGIFSGTVDSVGGVAESLGGGVNSIGGGTKGGGVGGVIESTGAAVGDIIDSVGEGLTGLVDALLPDFIFGPGGN
jgi:hypothetical protein